MQPPATYSPPWLQGCSSDCAVREGAWQAGCQPIPSTALPACWLVVLSEIWKAGRFKAMSVVPSKGGGGGAGGEGDGEREVVGEARVGEGVGKGRWAHQ